MRAVPGEAAMSLAVVTIEKVKVLRKYDTMSLHHNATGPGAFAGTIGRMSGSHRHSLRGFQQSIRETATVDTSRRSWMARRAFNTGPMPEKAARKPASVAEK